MEHPVAVIPGDGIGKEVVPEALRVLERTDEMWGFGPVRATADRRTGAPRSA